MHLLWLQMLGDSPFSIAVSHIQDALVYTAVLCMRNKYVITRVKAQYHCLFYVALMLIY